MKGTAQNVCSKTETYSYENDVVGKFYMQFGRFSITALPKSQTVDTEFVVKISEGYGTSFSKFKA